MIESTKPSYLPSGRALSAYKNILSTSSPKLEDRVRGTNLLLQLFLSAKKVGATEICISKDSEQTEAQQVSFLSKKENETSSATGVLYSADDFNLLLHILHERLSHWHEVGDSLFDLSSEQDERILLAPASPFRLMATVTSAKNRGTPSLTFRPLIWDGVTPASSMLMLNNSYKEGFLDAVKRKNGIILVNRPTEPLRLAAHSIVLALRPDAIFFPSPPAGEDFEKLVQLAANYLVVVGSALVDPVEMLYSFLSPSATNNALHEQACNQLLMSFVHLRIRRTCNSCVRSTPVSPDTLQRLPDVLLPLAKETYMFSRGCPQCGNAAYRGSIGLDSIVSLDNKLRMALLQRTSAKDFTALAYEAGARSLLEDGLRKIYSGLSSFEQVFSVVTNISADFDAAAKAAASPVEDLQLKLAPEETSIRQVSSAYSATTVISRPANKRRVLIVEDESDQRDVLRLVFQSEGYEVVTAENGKDALSVLEEKNVDLIVSDVMMPVMSGREFLKALRALPIHLKTPIMMLTAVENAEDEFSFLEEGADDYCKKNVKRKILMQRVEKLIERKKKTNPVGHLLEG